MVTAQLSQVLWLKWAVVWSRVETYIVCRAPFGVLIPSPCLVFLLALYFYRVVYFCRDCVVPPSNTRSLPVLQSSALASEWFFPLLSRRLVFVGQPFLSFADLVPETFERGLRSCLFWQVTSSLAWPWAARYLKRLPGIHKIRNDQARKRSCRLVLACCFSQECCFVVLVMCSACGSISERDGKWARAENAACCASCFW